jgi:hypothetical protein
VLTLGLNSFKDARTGVGITDSLEEVRFGSLEVAVSCAEGFEEPKYLLAIFDALLGVNEGYLAAFGVVGSEEGRPAPVLVNGSEFVREVVDVRETGIESKPSCWRK